MADSPNRKTARPLTTLGGVEPVIRGLRPGEAAVIADGRAALMRAIRERPTAADLDLARSLAATAPAPPEAATLPGAATLPLLPEREP